MKLVRFGPVGQEKPGLLDAEGRIRDLERLLGRKTMEVEILREALSVARGKKPVWQLPSPPLGGSR